MKPLQQFINENMEDAYGELPWLYELGNGNYTGLQSGYSIVINNKTYRVPTGVRGFNCRMSWKVDGQNMEII